jgi:hypothetical protein
MTCPRLPLINREEAIHHMSERRTMGSKRIKRVTATQRLRVTVTVTLRIQTILEMMKRTHTISPKMKMRARWTVGSSTNLTCPLGHTLSLHCLHTMIGVKVLQLLLVNISLMYPTKRHKRANTIETLRVNISLLPHLRRKRRRRRRKRITALWMSSKRVTRNTAGGFLSQE